MCSALQEAAAAVAACGHSKDENQHVSVAAKHAASWAGTPLAAARKPLSRLQQEQAAWKAAAQQQQGSA